MTGPNDYRDLAKQCLEWAEGIDDEKRRQVFLDMAKLWMQTALEVERAGALLDDDPEQTGFAPGR